MPDYVETAVPGRPAIELVAYYEEFRDYYPQCELETKRWFVENVQPSTASIAASHLHRGMDRCMEVSFIQP